MSFKNRAAAVIVLIAGLVRAPWRAKGDIEILTNLVKNLLSPVVLTPNILIIMIIFCAFRLSILSKAMRMDGGSPILRPHRGHNA